MRYEFISADNHLDSRWLPRNLWQERVAAKFKDRAPKVIETENGSVWEWEGKPRGVAADGSGHAALAKKYFRNVPVAPGVLPPSNPGELLRHMDMAKIYAGIFFADTRKWGVQDPELKLEIYRCYNDFVLELNAHAPDRLLALPNLPTAFPERCAAEFERLLKGGAKAVEFGVFDVGQPIYEDVWEPIFAMAEEAQVPLCCHIGDKAGTPYPPNLRGSSLAHFSVVPFCVAKEIAQFVFCGAFERHPGLQVSFAECRIGWLPFLFSWMDRQVEERPADPTAPLSLLPSEYVKRNMTFTFEDDQVGVHMLPHDWANLKDSAIWGADYPHEQGTWPDAVGAIDRIFEGIDPALKREVLFDHAARLFKIEGGRA